MDVIEVIILALSGGAAGFVGGLLGIGGGIIFTPVLLFYFQSAGIPDEHVTPLAIGTGLLCTLIVAISSAVGHARKGVVDLKTAAFCGVASVFAIGVTTTVISTSSWYTPDFYRVAFAALLVVVAVRMIRQSFSTQSAEVESPGPNRLADRRGVSGRVGSCVLGGSLAGIIASAMGVGGGIVLVPLYDRHLGLPIRTAIGTSSATMVLITLVAVIGYMINGSGLSITHFSVGYIEVGRAFILSVPAAMSARMGVKYAHKTNQDRLRIIFAILALLVALRFTLAAAEIP